MNTPPCLSQFLKPRLVLKICMLSALLCSLALPAVAIRIKDIAYLRGARDNQLIGYGLVVGLDGTGDSEGTLLSRRPLRNALERMGLNLSPTEITGRSIAGVLVTAVLPPFAKAGSRIDVTVDALGDATSLRGGTLMLTPLNGANQQVYAAAQGVISGIPSGIRRDLDDNNAIPTRLDPRSSLVPTKGHVPNGGLVEREINLNLNTRTRVYINLKQSDFTTAFRLAKAVNRALGEGFAQAKDAGAIEISVPDSYLGRTVELLSRIENLEVEPDFIAKVIIDERTGSIVMGQHVRIAPVAISQGGIRIEVGAEADEVGDVPPGDAPGRLSPGSTTTIDRQITLFKGEVDLKEVVEGLNRIGASPADLVQVLRNIKNAGALHAELEIR